MARPKRWTQRVVDGVLEIELSAWRYFYEYITQNLLEYNGYVYRGQADSEWKLISTLDRVLQRKKLLKDPRVRDTHLTGFKYAVRGRRGPSPVEIRSENDWWALGQHHGLATPLLDWSNSPFVAAYFAFYSDIEPSSGKRTIYGLHKLAVEGRTSVIKDEAELMPGIQFVSPLADDNARLVNQGGLFTRAPDGMDVEEWIRIAFQGDNDRAILVRMSVPSKDRGVALRALNRMNINHLSLFPDLYGSSKHCNLSLDDPGY